MGHVQSTLTSTDSTSYLFCSHCAVQIDKKGVVVSRNESFTNIPFGAFIADYWNICNGKEKEKAHCFRLPDWSDKDEDKLGEREAVLERIIATRSANVIGNKKTNELTEPFLKRPPNQKASGVRKRNPQIIAKSS
eukprot:260128_1